jgi:uroporphyrinogen-III synthase
MSLPIIAIRPEPGGSATVAAAATTGLEVVSWPLFAVEARDWETPPPAAFDALLLGSANAVRHFGPELADWQGKPAYAVGSTTAAAARDAGLAIAAVGQGGLQDLLDTLAGPLRLLRVAGEEHVPLVAPPDVTIETRIAYATVAQPLSSERAARLTAGALVLLHSAAAARHFAAECDRCKVPRAQVALAAMGPRIAAAAGGGWRAIEVAATASEPALLALARQMCHTLAQN